MVQLDQSGESSRPEEVLSCSARKTNTARVRAAPRPGSTATTFTRTIALSGTSTTEPTGTDGWGTAYSSRGKSVQSQRQSAIPSGTPMTTPATPTMEACHATAAGRPCVPR
jgi:hypothetical protein